MDPHVRRVDARRRDRRDEATSRADGPRACVDRDLPHDSIRRPTADKRYAISLSPSSAAA